MPRLHEHINIAALFPGSYTPALPHKILRAALPFTLLLAPNGDVLHQQLGEADVPALRRAILASLADDPQHPGMQKHWKMH